MKAKKFYSNNSGSMMLQAIFAIAFVSTAALMFMKVTKISSQLNRSDIIRSNVRDSEEIIAMTLASSQGCNNTIAKGALGTDKLEDKNLALELTDQPIGSAGYESKSLELGNLYNSEGMEILKVGEKLDGRNFQIEGVRLVRFLDPATSLERTYIDVTFDLNADDEKNKAVLGGQKTTKRFPIQVNYEPITNKILSCTDSLDEQIETASSQMCVKTGGTWDVDKKECNTGCADGMILVSGACKNPLVTVSKEDVCSEYPNSYWDGSKCITCGSGLFLNTTTGTCSQLIEPSSFGTAVAECKTNCGVVALEKSPTNDKQYQYYCEPGVCPEPETVTVTETTTDKDTSNCKCMLSENEVSDENRKLYCTDDSTVLWVCEDTANKAHGSYCGNGTKNVETASQDPVEMEVCDQSKDSVPSIKSLVEVYNKPYTGYGTASPENARLMSMSVPRPAAKLLGYAATCTDGTCGKKCKDIYPNYKEVAGKPGQYEGIKYEELSCEGDCKAKRLTYYSGYSYSKGIDLPPALNGTKASYLVPGKFWDNSGIGAQTCSNEFFGDGKCSGGFVFKDGGSYQTTELYAFDYTEIKYKCDKGNWALDAGSYGAKKKHCVCSCEVYTQYGAKGDAWKNAYGYEDAPLTDKSTYYYYEMGESAYCVPQHGVTPGSYGTSNVPVVGNPYDGDYFKGYMGGW